ncbi:MAG TPA: PepSY-associated TM helix domain-containing protein [Pyrinomonadaceae bacterium]
MKRLRKIIFWCHLPVGVIAGLVVLIMCVTGVLLTYEKQIILWADTRHYQSAPSGSDARHLPVETLIENARNHRGANPTSITLRSNPSAPAEFGFGRESAPLFLNPYSGQVHGEGSPQVRSFFRTVTDWHRWLGAKGENRNVARAITGASNLGFLFLVISGFYLWWPRNWNLKALRSAMWFRRGLPARARDFNWHNVIGFWSAAPLFIIVLSAVVISYTWAGNLVYRIAGETPPAPRANQPNANAGTKKDPQALNNLNSHFVRAQQQTGDWQSISLQLPTSAAAQLTFNIDSGTGGQPQKRAQLVLDRTSGDVVRWEPFSSYSRGRQLRSILRFAHTGEVLGVPGQTIAGIVSIGGAVLVITGLALAFRRLYAWLGRRAKSKLRAVAVADPLPDSVGD